MPGFELLDDKLRIKPGVFAVYSAGKPARDESDIPQTAAAGVKTELKAEPADSLRLGLNGQISIRTYQEFNKLTILNPQFPSIKVYQSDSNLSEINFKLDEAKLDWFGETLSLSIGYQNVIVGTNEFPFAPANTFAGRDFSTPEQTPEPRSIPLAKISTHFGGHYSLSILAAPSAETRDIIPLKERLISESLSRDGIPAKNIDVKNAGYEADVDALTTFKADWTKIRFLLELGHEHDHFFKIGNGKVSPGQNGALDFSAKLIYPRRETAAAELSGVLGNLIYWAQANLSYYPDQKDISISSPLGQKKLEYSEYFHQEAAGIKYYFPSYYAFVAAQIFNGSVTGNGEYEKRIASLSFGKQFLNGDLKIKADLNCYFDAENADFESYLSSSYRVLPELEISLGGRIAEEDIFTLAPSIFGFIGIEYNF